MTMTQMQSARAGKITDEMKIVAQEEKMDIETLRERVANGTIAICANINHQNLHPYGVGEGLCTKVNANIGTSSAFPDPAPEIEKLNVAIASGAHSVMEEAKQLLSSSDQLVYEIAEELGFKDSKYFISRFTEETGMSPAEYRRKKGN